jgi:hypothetical protein
VGDPATAAAAGTGSGGPGDGGSEGHEQTLHFGHAVLVSNFSARRHTMARDLHTDRATQTAMRPRARADCLLTRLLRHLRMPLARA